MPTIRLYKCKKCKLRRYIGDVFPNFTSQLKEETEEQRKCKHDWQPAGIFDGIADLISKLTRCAF